MVWVIEKHHLFGNVKIDDVILLIGDVSSPHRQPMFTGANGLVWEGILTSEHAVQFLSLRKKIFTFERSKWVGLAGNFDFGSERGCSLGIKKVMLEHQNITPKSAPVVVVHNCV